jgi:hypothetical protein
MGKGLKVGEEATNDAKKYGRVFLGHFTREESKYSAGQRGREKN